MSRSRALNRSSRLNAKKRRRSLRSAIPSLQDGSSKKIESTSGHAQQLLQKAFQKELQVDLLEPELGQ